MIQPKISVVTVCYNAVNDIEKTILSVINQTYPNVEYLIIDGGSTDGTMDVVNRYKDKIDVIVSEPDKGIYDAMNKGIKRATGEWVNLMNAGDCFVDENVLDKIFSLQISDSTSFIYSDALTNDERKNKWIWHTSFKDKVLCHQSIIYKKALHLEYGYYIVTPRPLISDSLFEVRIPVEQTMKVDTIIAYYEGGGISSNLSWVLEGLYSLRVLYREQSIHKMYFSYLLRRLIATMPQSFRLKVKRFLKR